MRGIEYRNRTDSPYLKMAMRKGWSLKKIEVVCALNAFYQVILGPLSSPTFAELKDNSLIYNSIKYGSIVVTKEEISQINDCHIAFYRIINELDIDFWALQANHYDDLIYCLAKPKEKDEQ